MYRLDHSQNPLPIRKASGHIILTDPEFGVKEYDTLTCVHCQHVWTPIKGSGIERGFCMKCKGPTCGHENCNECYPWEKRMDDYEKGKLISL